MRSVFLPLFTSLFVASNVLAQITPATPTRGTGPKPTTFKAAAITVQVTDSVGAPLGTALVTATGPVSREGETSPDGTIQLLNLRAGTYRLRVEREGSITLEREVTVRAGESPTVDVTLTAAPPPPKAPEPVAPPPPTRTLGAPGDPKITAVPLFLEKNFIGGREARKESALGCAATGTGTLHQLRDTWTAHTHDDADEWIYVVAGEGVLRLPGSEQRLQAGTFSLVPHTISHTLVPQGRNPLIVISVLSGPACKAG
jgi:mannose-6-phosphate isomerase-like protein (cupin superfamily)